MTGTAASTRIAPRSRWYDAVAAGGGQYLSANASGHAPGSYVSVHPLVIYPIVVDVIRTEAAVLERWWHQAIAISLSALSAAICLTLLLRALSRQITLIQLSEARFAAQSALLETTLEQMNQGVIMADADGIVAVCNRRALEILDLPAEMMAAHPRSADVLEFERQRGEFMLSESTTLDPAFLSTNQITYERRRPNGTVVEIHNVPLPGGGVLRTYTDVTVRATAEQMLGTAASRDPLTGLANRGGFNIRLDAAVTAARRETTQMAVLCLDLDHFKAVNDTLGHEAGDQLLQTVAQRMRDIARSTDVVGRMGGDEFAIALPGVARTVAEKVSERLLEAMRLPYVLGQETVRIGVSIGIAAYPADGATAEQLLRNADTALYLAKAEGRNTWRNFTSADGDREHQRVQFEQDLRTAVELRHLALAYQPICDAVTREPKAFEALLRWNHPARGPIAPGEFIPVAEQLGLIVPLGRWMLEVACAEAATWARPLHIAVNLSPAQFHDRDLLQFVQDVLARTGLSPDRLDLEVTEQLLLDDTENVVQTMQSLRAIGIRMVLDDFGTARSNLNYLRGFPFNAVKIDRSFLRALSSDPQARALVEAILAVARALGLDVIGEGVETQEQLALLCQLQCRLVQGYLLGSPAPSEATRALIRNLTAADAAAGQSTRLAVSSAGV